MNYDTLANTVTAFHATILLCVLLGILISIRYKRFRPVESLFFLTFIVIWSLYGACPLTDLEYYLRLHTLHPSHINQIGFIPFYVHKFFNITLARHTVVYSTYATAGIFVLASVEWMSPVLNMEVIKLRESIKKRRFVRSKKTKKTRTSKKSK